MRFQTLLNANAISPETLLNKILFQLTSSPSTKDSKPNFENSLHKAIFLYKSLQHVVDICDKELSVELILVSFTHTMSIKPIWIALQLSIIILYSLDQSGNVNILYKKLYLPTTTSNSKRFIYKTETLNFVEKQIVNFQNNFITDELQRCRLESSFKRAISGNLVKFSFVGILMKI